jgi:serine/threonine protein kinase
MLCVVHRAYLCKNRHSGRENVVKLILPHGGEHGEEFSEAVKETELQQRLAGSEFVASVYAWGTIAGQYLWVLMELCAGGSLESLIEKKHGTIDHEQRMAWCSQMALGLLHMHELLVMHRDVKPVRFTPAL